MLIGVFIFLSGPFEAQQAEISDILKDFRVKDVMIKHFIIFDEKVPLRNAVKTMLEGQDKEFIITRDNRVTGVLTKNTILKGLAEKGVYPTRLKMLFISLWTASISFNALSINDIIKSSFYDSIFTLFALAASVFGAVTVKVPCLNLAWMLFQSTFSSGTLLEKLP